MSDGKDNAELISTVKSSLSAEGAKVFSQALEENAHDALWALGGLSEAFAKQEQAISAGYSRRGS